ncbi:tRNA1(Val) (adenine(37)-N6)-methyltransferase [Conservatibacter flavescens]|uniref:tRNA1(Val) (adenine(37)-N6)-methyltransferase n=1 Tax=Conservatibacter flavescens TaxID=28161 RepID=A0A2M8S071_9PAST|nr:methyltransferase [Conservatibacter flavescens]PJG84543.1 tRNA (adenosine(37)-N6)-methyltransferase TrmM [Conservatibacter flavescens]
MSGFRFKQFYVEQEHTAMKVGTDGVLLGAWASHTNPSHILDLGTGTGLLTLMLAQRYPQAQLSAVELDEAAFKQAQFNVQQSLWSERIQLFHRDIVAFSQSNNQKFDLIVANPPYFETGCQCRSTARHLARYTDTLTHLDWLRIAADCLSDEGNIAFVLPFSAGEQLKTWAKSTALYCVAQTDIITKTGKTPQRMLLSFAFQERPREKKILAIYDENSQYHPDFITLTQAFYLRF